MLRLFLPAGAVREGRVRIAGPSLRHLHTMRLGPERELVVVDDAGREHTVRLEAVGRREALGRVVASARVERESPLALVLAPALLKGPRMDVVVEKTTELGVRALAPVVTERCVARRGHLERWRRIALAAAKQCGRTAVPAIEEPRPLAERLAAPWPGLRLCAFEGAAGAGWEALPAQAAAAVVLLGPEGGFTGDEVAAIAAAGFQTIGLGRRILRAETAAIVAAALCQRRWGDG